MRENLYPPQMYHVSSTSALTVSSYLMHSCCGSSTESSAVAWRLDLDLDQDLDLGTWLPPLCHDPLARYMQAKCLIMISQLSWKEESNLNQVWRLLLQ